MLISVIVPVYNAEKYIYDCIDSIIEQTYTKIEIILVDDGTPDNCGKICDEYSKRDDRVKVVHQKNGGQFSARISGIKKASGEYLVFLDADDMIKTTAIQTIVDKINQVDCDMLIFEASRTNDFSGKYMDIPLEKNKVYSGESLKEIYRLALTTGKLNCMCMKVVKSDLININNDFSEYYHIRNGEDTLMALMAIAEAKKICYIDDILYYYRINEESISFKYNDNLYYDLKTVEQKRREYSIHWFGKIEKSIYNRNLKVCYKSIMYVLASKSKSIRSRCKKVKEILDDEFFKSSYSMAEKSAFSIFKRITIFIIVYLKMSIAIACLYDVKQTVKAR